MSQFNSLATLACLLLGLAACGDDSTNDTLPQGYGGSAGQSVRADYGGFDRGRPRLDMRIQPQMDAGVVDRGASEPAVYIPYGQCPEEVSFVGQLTGRDAPVPNGGLPFFGRFDRAYDSGLETVYARLPQRSSRDDPPPVTVDVQVSRATVVATRPKANPDGTLSTSRARFWVADGRRTMEVFLNLVARDASPFEIRVGQIISFRARTIGYYGARPQIQEASGFILHEDGAAHATLDGPGQVAVFEPDRLLTSADIPTLVRITGLIEGEPVRCGGEYTCWQMAGPMELTYRTEETDLRSGTCITFVGPLSGFGEQVQLEAFNSDWVRRYQRGAAFEEACETGTDCASGVCISLGEDKFCSLACDGKVDCPSRYDCTFDRCLPSFGSTCPESTNFVGQIQGENAIAPNGGRFSLDPYPNDFSANVATAIAQSPTAANSNPDPVTTNLLIDGAVITSTHSRQVLVGPDSDREIPASQSRFTIADGTGSIEVFLDVGGVGATPDFEVKSGMVVALTATQLDRYQGKAQIKRANWQPFDASRSAHPEVGVGTDALVSVFEPDRAFERSDISRIVRVMGTLIGEGQRCGGQYRCWSMDYGFGDPLVVRTSHEDVFSGVCVTFTGPLGFYDGNFQLDVANPDWLIVNDGDSTNP